MTQIENQFDWLDEAEADPREPLNQAAADLALEVRVILDHALRARTDLTQADLAPTLDVTPGRVSQVLNGDGNLHVGTIARYLRALGYELRMQPHSVDSDAPNLQRETRTVSRVHVYKTRFADGTGVYEGFQTLRSESDEAPVPLEIPQHVTSRRLSPQKRSYVADHREPRQVPEVPNSASVDRKSSSFANS